MAPIPDDKQEKISPRDEEFTIPNGNQAPIFGSDSSDENDDNYPDTTGYMLLPQEPGVDIDDYGSDNNDDGDFSNAELSANTNEHISSGDSDRQNESEISNDSVVRPANNSSNVFSDSLPDEVIQSEAGAAAPYVTASTSLHPEFLAKFPDGKVPSYMQVPDVPLNRKDALWNKRRQEKRSSLEPAEAKNIMKAMSGFSLPSENVPDWAKGISEDQWNNVITQQIKPSECTTDSSTEAAQKQEEWVAEFPDS